MRERKVQLRRGEGLSTKAKTKRLGGKRLRREGKLDVLALWSPVCNIDLLREQFPGKWKWLPRERCWQHEDGWCVEPRACSAPRYDGDDDTFITRYFRTDTNEEVCLLLLPRREPENSSIQTSPAHPPSDQTIMNPDDESRLK